MNPTLELATILITKEAKLGFYHTATHLHPKP